MSRSNANRFTTGFVAWPQCGGRLDWRGEQEPGWYDSGEGGLWVFLVVPSEGIDDPFENCCMNGASLPAPDVLVGGSWPGKLGQSDTNRQLEEEIWPGLHEHYDSADYSAPRFYIPACKGCGWTAAMHSTGQQVLAGAVTSGAKRELLSYQAARAAAEEHCADPGHYALAPGARRHEPTVLESQPIVAPPESRDLLAAICLGSNRISFTHSNGGYFNATRDDLTDEGKQLYDLVATLYQREPLLLTFLDT